VRARGREGGRREGRSKEKVNRLFSRNKVIVILKYINFVVILIIFSIVHTSRSILKLGNEQFLGRLGIVHLTLLRLRFEEIEADVTKLTLLCASLEDRDIGLHGKKRRKRRSGRKRRRRRRGGGGGEEEKKKCYLDRCRSSQEVLRTAVPRVPIRTTASGYATPLTLKKKRQSLNYYKIRKRMTT